MSHQDQEAKKHRRRERKSEDIKWDYVCGNYGQHCKNIKENIKNIYCNECMTSVSTPRLKKKLPKSGETPPIQKMLQPKQPQLCGQAIIQLEKLQKLKDMHGKRDSSYTQMTDTRDDIRDIYYMNKNIKCVCKDTAVNIKYYEESGIPTCYNALPCPSLDSINVATLTPVVDVDVDTLRAELIHYLGYDVSLFMPEFLQSSELDTLKYSLTQL